MRIPTKDKLTRNSVDYAVEGRPSVSCRLTSRLQLNWARAYQSLFPDSFQTIRQQTERREHLGFIYQARLTFRLDGHILPNRGEAPATEPAAAPAGPKTSLPKGKQKDMPTN